MSKRSDGRRRRVVTALAAAAMVSAAFSGAHAQSGNEGDAERQTTPDKPSVYELHLAVDVPVIVAAGSVGLVRALFADELVRYTCPCDPSGVNALDRRAVGNDVRGANLAANITVYGTMAALPLLDALDLGFHRVWFEDLVVYMEALAVDTAIQNIVNFTVARPRPRTYAGDPEFVHGSEGYLSFYAGHVATAFTAMSVASFTLRARYHVGIWPWLATVAVGGSVAVERIASGHHFPSDVAAAAVAGTTIGVAVPWAHRRRGPVLSVLTIPAGGGLALRGVF